MSVQDTFYVKSLTNYLNDIKPYHSKILEVLVEYQYDDSFSASVEDYLFTTAHLNSNWCQTHMLTGSTDLASRTFDIPPVVVPRLLSTTGEASYRQYDALDFTGGQYYTNFPRPEVTLVHPVSLVPLTPAELGDTASVEHAILAQISPITIANGYASGGQITGFVIYNKLLWNPTAGTITDDPSDPGLDSNAVLASLGDSLGFTPQVVISHPRGFGCKADCVMTAGTVTAINVRNQQNVADRDVYRIKGQIDHRRLDKILITHAGQNYIKPPIVRLRNTSLPGAPVVADAQLVAHIRDSLTAITVNSKSSKFETTPRVTIAPPSLSDQLAWLAVDPSRTLADWTAYNKPASGYVGVYYDNTAPSNTTYAVEAVHITDAGAGYMFAPEVLIHSFLDRVELLTTGRGYTDTNAMPVIVRDNGVDRGAVVTATVVNGSITSFTVHDGGGNDAVGQWINDDYVNVTVEIPPPQQPGGIQATARAIIYGLSQDPARPVATADTSLIEIEILNPGTGYLNPPQVEVINDTSLLNADPENADLLDTPYPGAGQAGAGMQCRALMTGFAPWDVTVTLRNALLPASRFTIGGPNSSLIQFNDGYAPVVNDGEFFIECAVLDSLTILLNDMFVPISTTFNMVLPNTDPDAGFGGSFTAPSSPEDIDDPLTPLTPDLVAVTLNNYDTGGYDGSETTAIGTSTRTELYSGLLRVGTMYVPLTIPENPSNNYVFIFDPKWWMINIRANDTVTFCVAERDNYSPEVLTAFAESFTVSDTIYMYEHFGVSFSGQYVKRSDGTVRCPAAALDAATYYGPDATTYEKKYADAVAPFYTNTGVMTVGLIPNADFLHGFGMDNPISQQRKISQITKIMTTPNSVNNSVYQQWRDLANESSIPANTVIDPIHRYDYQILKFDGVYRKSDSLPHSYAGPTTAAEMTAYNNMTLVERAAAYPASTYLNTRNTIHDAEFLSMQMASAYHENAALAFEEIATPPAAFGYARDMGYIGFYDSVMGYDPTGQAHFDRGVIENNAESTGTSMSEDLLMISKILTPAEFDVSGSDTGGWDVATLRYEASAFKTVPPQDIVPGAIEVSDNPLQVITPITFKLSKVIVRHSVPFPSNIVPTLIVERWDENLSQYVLITKNVDFAVALIPSTISGSPTVVNDTFEVTLNSPMSVRISYLWY